MRAMTKRHLLALFVLAAAAGLAAQSEPKYRAPRTADGQPDLHGVWNFSSNVPLERPSVWADRKTVTLDEVAQRGKAKDNALKMVATFAPVEDVGVTLLDHVSHVQDPRTSLITYPGNGRLPKLVDGAARAFGAEQLIEAIADGKPGAPPWPSPELTALLAPPP